MQSKLVERLQTLADALEEAVDHIEMLEAVLNMLEKSHPELVARRAPLWPRRRKTSACERRLHFLAGFLIL